MIVAGGYGYGYYYNGGSYNEGGAIGGGVAAYIFCCILFPLILWCCCFRGRGADYEGSEHSVEIIEETVVHHDKRPEVVYGDGAPPGSAPPAYPPGTYGAPGAPPGSYGQAPMNAGQFQQPMAY